MQQEMGKEVWNSDGTPGGSWPDFYALLRVSPKAEPEELRQAINSLYGQATANTDHRDLSKRFYYQTLQEKVLPQARRILLDEASRRAYDNQWHKHRQNAQGALPYADFLASLPSGTRLSATEASSLNHLSEDDLAAFPVVSPVTAPVENSRVLDPEVEVGTAQGWEPSTYAPASKEEEMEAEVMEAEVMEGEVIEAEVVEEEGVDAQASPAREALRGGEVHPAVLRASQARAGRTRGAESDEDWALNLKTGEAHDAVQRAALRGSRAIVKVAPQSLPATQTAPVEIKVPVATPRIRPAGKTGAVVLGAVLLAGLGWGAMHALAPANTSTSSDRAADTQRQVELAVQQALAHNAVAAASYREVVPTSEKSAQNWKYTLGTPPSTWSAKNFNSASWKAGRGGFGTDTPGSGPISTPWNTADIWMRRTFDPGSLTHDQISRLVIRDFHDEDVDVFINGAHAYSSLGFITSYESIALSDEAKAAIIPNATNTLAVHCHQTTGGQYIDVGIYERNPSKP